MRQRWPRLQTSRRSGCRQSCAGGAPGPPRWSPRKLHRETEKDTGDSGRELHGDKGEGSLRMLRTETKAGELLRELRTIAPGWGRAGRGGVEKTNQIHPNSFFWWGAY